jgi:16S rRNA (guanine1516-N2)-methyltransferase
MLVKIAIFTEHSKLQQKADELANHLNLPLTKKPEEFDVVLVVATDHIELVEPKTKQRPVYVDFSSSTLQRRIKQKGKELIAKAVGIKGNYFPSVIDATAGLAKDAFILANLGCKVTMIEKSPIIASLLKDALTRLFLSPNLKSLKLDLIEGNSNVILKSPKITADVVYLDPMFPERSKSALVKKEMRLIKKVVGPEEDMSNLFKNALLCAKKRIVVKRPRLATTVLVSPEPDIVFEGRSTRFDVYLI